MARAILGFADGQNLTAASGTKVIGLLGWTNGESNAEDNLLSVVGEPYQGMSPSSTVPTVVGGYFFGNDAHTTNLGTVGQVGGSTDQAWQDGTFSGVNAAVVGMNYNTASSTNLAGYFGGNVVVTGSTTTSGNTIANGNLILGTESDAESVNMVTVSGNVEFANVTGSDAGTITVTVTNGTNGQVLILYNGTTGGGTLSLNGSTVAQGKISTFVYYGGWRGTN